MTISNFQGLSVAAFESRMAGEMDRLIRRYGGYPLVAPALQEVPLEDNSAALQFGAELLEGRVDILVLLTGVGTKSLVEVLRTRYSPEAITEALRRTVLVARGPKSTAALKTLGLTPTLSVPEPNTWHDLLATLDTYRPVKGLRVAIQEYGVSNRELLDALRARGAEVAAVPVYRWALPDDTGPLHRLLEQLLAGRVDAMLITNAAQIDHVMQLLERDGQVDGFRRACQRMVVASIGPTASERLREHALPVDLQPSHPRMGVLVKETSEQVQELLHAKRRA